MNPEYKSILGKEQKSSKRQFHAALRGEESCCKEDSNNSCSLLGRGQVSLRNKMARTAKTTLKEKADYQWEHTVSFG